MGGKLMTGITLNGITTVELCPMGCGNTMTVRHGHDDNGNRKHYEVCPECGTSLPMVAYECADCDGEAGIEEVGDG